MPEWIVSGVLTELSWEVIGFLWICALLAGFVDAVAGGGGLIQLPALLIAAPQFSLPLLFGTNKLASICGTSMACYRYAKKISLPWKLIFPSMCFAFLGSFLGASFVSQFPRDVLEPLILGLLILVAAHSFWKKDFGLLLKLSVHRKRHVVGSAVVGFFLGFYDGFFGPGTGGFLIFLFILLMGLDFLKASASSKFVNVATNFAALLFFVPTGHVIWSLGLTMGGFNLLGGFLGSQIAIRKGASWIRVFFLIVILAIQARLAWQIFFS